MPIIIVNYERNTAVKRLHRGKRNNNYVASFQAVRTKLSLTSYVQPHEPVSHGALKTYNFFSVRLEKEL